MQKCNFAAVLIFNFCRPIDKLLKRIFCGKKKGIPFLTKVVVIQQEKRGEGKHKFN